MNQIQPPYDVIRPEVESLLLKLQAMQFTSAERIALQQCIEDRTRPLTHDESISLMKGISTNLDRMNELWQELVLRCEQDMKDNP